MVFVLITKMSKTTLKSLICKYLKKNSVICKYPSYIAGYKMQRLQKQNGPKPKRPNSAALRRFFAHLRIFDFYEKLGLGTVFCAQPKLYN